MADDERVVTPLESLSVPIEPYYSMLSIGDRPIASSLPAFTAQRGGIAFKRWTPEELAAERARVARNAKIARRRRRLARPFHRLAAPLLRLAYVIGPEVDRPKPRDDWHEDW